ncbi:EYxxD motif small membrane protein [Brevibacillus marinus]|nr:EYxxD motif small membrane protein [Brevibacillus marinus]
MRILGPPLYEWFSHNLFVGALIVGTVAVMIFFAVNTARKKGRYRYK